MGSQALEKVRSESLSLSETKRAELAHNLVAILSIDAVQNSCFSGGRNLSITVHTDWRCN